MKKPFLPDVTIMVIDCTDKVHLAHRAMRESWKQCEFGRALILSDQKVEKFAGFEIGVIIPKISSLEEYSRFVIRELHKYVTTSHCLLIQSDGYVLNGSAWRPEFLQCDYIGAPWEHQGGLVGNGGFSLRSRRFLKACATVAPEHSGHPEDWFISMGFRQHFEAIGMKYASTALARKFGFEGRAFDGVEWSGTINQYAGSFGFHSWLSRLPDDIDRPLIFHSSGDAGDVVYSLATVKALGGGYYFLSNDCKHPYPKKPKCASQPTEEFHANVGPLVHRQPYIWGCRPTHATPYSCDANFDEFREAYRRGGLQNWMSLLALHGRPFGVEFPRDAIVEPWLECDDLVVVEGRPIVVSNTGRYFNAEFPWWTLCRKYGSQMVFVGTEHEHALFQALVPDIPIPHHRTANLWEVARVIQGAKCCILNQSAPLAIAHGLGKRVLVSEWPANANCHLNRGADAVYYKDGPPPTGLPEGWV